MVSNEFLLHVLAQVLRNQRDLAALLYAEAVFPDGKSGFLHHQDIYDKMQRDTDKMLDHILEPRDA